MTHQKENRMKKVLIAAGVVSIVSMTLAQKLEVGVDGGYGFWASAALAGQNITVDQDWSTLTKYEQVYATAGKGVKIMGEVAYFLTENIGVMASAGYSMKNEYTTEVKDPGGSRSVTTATSYLPINIGLKFRGKIGIVVPYVYVAPGIILPAKTETFDTIANAPFNHTRGERTYTYAPGFSVSAGIGAAIILPILSDRVGIKAEFAPTYAFASPTKYTENGSTFTYKNNTSPADLRPGEVSDQPHDSFCSLAIRGGICIKIF
jgi:hypothetical protein